MTTYPLSHLHLHHHHHHVHALDGSTHHVTPHNATYVIIHSTSHPHSIITCNYLQSMITRRIHIHIHTSTLPLHLLLRLQPPYASVNMIYPSQLIVSPYHASKP